MCNKEVVDKCRICLTYSKTLQCIYSCEKDVTFAEMINSLANVKITNDTTFDKICRRCRRRLIEAYDFKSLIDRSSDTLNDTLNLKKITFNNLNDIKIKIEIDPEDQIHTNKASEDINEFFKDGVNEISYSNTVIKKLENGKEQLDESQPIPVLDFLKSLNQDADDNFHFDDYDNMDNFVYDSDGDDEYLPINVPLASRKSKKKIQNKNSKVQNPAKPKRIRAESLKLTKVCIQPVYLHDIKLLKTESKKPANKDPSKKKVYPNRNRELMCPHCGKMTKSLKSHMQIHSGATYACNLCSKVYSRKRMLERHILRHAGKKDYKCEQCVAAFVDKHTLKKHMLIHSGERRHECSICGKRFKRRGALLRHERAHNSANKNVLCELCNMSFFCRVGLRHHMRVHTGERPYNCEICSQPYSYKHDFNRHCFKKHGVFLKRRSVYVMNEEVLKQEKLLMRDLILRVNGLVQDGQPINPFEGPQAALAFEQAIKALKSKQITVDF